VLLCFLGVLPAIFLSQLPSFNFSEAWRTGFFFFKVLVYYVLLISVVNSGPRLKIFIGWLVCCCVLLALITLLQYHEVLTLPTLKSVTDTDMDRVTGEVTTFGRLQGPGIFNDPNDLGGRRASAWPRSQSRL